MIEKRRRDLFTNPDVYLQTKKLWTYIVLHVVMTVLVPEVQLLYVLVEDRRVEGRSKAERGKNELHFFSFHVKDCQQVVEEKGEDIEPSRRTQCFSIQRLSRFLLPKQLGFVAGLALLSTQTVRSIRHGGSVAGDNAGDTKHGSHFSRGVTQVSGAGKRSRTNLATVADCYRTQQLSLVFSGLLSPRQPKQ